MDATDELARKLIEAFEELGEEVALEQLAVPEDLADPQGSVDLWVTSTVASFGASRKVDQFMIHAKVSVPTAVLLEREVEDLVRLFREELLHSKPFRRASTSAGVASRAAKWDGVPSPEEAERN